MVDYSKWRDIEISDDEDDTHPNVDTPSLFRWRHQARVDRMAEMEREREEFNNAKQSHKARTIQVKERLANKTGNEAELKKELEALEKEGKALDAREVELMKKEKKTPWNVDTISKPGFAKTVLNKQALHKPVENMTEEEREMQLKAFIKENEKLCKEYGMLRKYDDSKRFLTQHTHLACEETANYLVIWAINLEMEEKHDLMAHVAHQCICMQYILELAKQLSCDPRSCISSFFTKIQNCLPEYRQQFDDEIKGFKKRIEKRAQEKIAEAIAEAEEEERQQRLGPGGLDPAEVVEELPDELKKCFETRDVELLQKTIAAMPVEVAKYHMARCVASGLWVTNASDAEDETEHDDKDDKEENANGTDDAKQAQKQGGDNDNDNEPAN